MEPQRNYLNDMEEELEKGKYSEKTIRLVQNMANFYISQEQLANKGNLLGHFKSGRFLKTYIDVYERAIIGIGEIKRTRKPTHIYKGYACLKQAIVENGILYLVIDEDEIYRIRYLNEPEITAYLINKQKMKEAKKDTL